MSSQTSPSQSQSSQRPKSSAIDRFLKQIQLMYYQYEVTFSTYMLTPGEKVVLNTIIIVLLSMFTWATFFYLPRFLTRAATRLFWLHAGTERALELISPENETIIWQELEPILNF